MGDQTQEEKKGRHLKMPSHQGLEAAGNTGSWPTCLDLWFARSGFGPWNLPFKSSQGDYEDWMDWTFPKRAHLSGVQVQLTIVTILCHK